MASENSFVFSQPDLPSCSFSAFYDMKKSGQLTDVTIRINGRVFEAHRIILAAAIPYFRAVFTCNSTESREKQMAMEELDSSALESLIDFAYTSEVKITVENVQSLLVASEFLQLTQVRDSCCDFLSKRLDLRSIMTARTLAEGFSCSSLLENVDIYIGQNFEVFCQTEEFLSLSFTFLNDLLRRDDLRVSSEEKVFDAVMRWVKTDTERHQFLPDLLTGVRMTFLTVEFLINKASKEKLIIDSVSCRNLLDEVKHYHLLPEQVASSSSFKVSERWYRPCGIYLFCCNKSSGLTIFKYITATGKWNSVLSDERRSDLKNVLALGNEIYIFRKNAFEAFDPVNLEWTPRAFRKCYGFKHVVPYNGKIHHFPSVYPRRRILKSYVKNISFEPKCGGMWFDKQQNQWLSFENSIFLFFDDTVVPSRNIMYILGSQSRHQETNQRNAVYNFLTHTTSEMSGMQSSRCQFGSIVLGETLYVCGGVSSGCNAREDKSALRTVETYSSQRWRTVSPMNLPRKNFSLVTYEKKLYAIGGTTESTDFIEFYDPDTDKWTLAGGSLDGQYDFVKAVAISG